LDVGRLPAGWWNWRRRKLGLGGKRNPGSGARIRHRRGTAVFCRTVRAGRWKWKSNRKESYGFRARRFRSGCGEWWLTIRSVWTAQLKAESVFRTSLAMHGRDTLADGPRRKGISIIIRGRGGREAPDDERQVHNRSGGDAARRGAWRAGGASDGAAMVMRFSPRNGEKRGRELPTASRRLV